MSSPLVEADQPPRRQARSRASQRLADRLGPRDGDDLARLRGLALSLVARRREAGAGASRISERALDEAAGSLADLVHRQGERTAGDRKLLEPAPIVVPWVTCAAPVTGSVRTAVESRRFPPLPGLSAVGSSELQCGAAADLHAVYGGIGSGRLVIVGTPGAGKSATAIMLVLAALRHRQAVGPRQRAAVPVPVLFGMHGWNPDLRSSNDWLASRLQQEYRPLFPGKRGYALASELVRRGRIAAVLDGLDEMPANLRPVAMRALSDQATFRVVLLARTTEILTAARTGFLTGAAAIQLQDVDAARAADYLDRVQLDPPPSGWRQLVGRLRLEPDGAMARSLSSPLALTLVRDTYRSNDDVRELLDFCDGRGAGLSREDVEDHLLDRVVPVAYALRPGGPPAPYSARLAGDTLALIARLMNSDASRDLAWWEIPRWSPVGPRDLVTVSMGGLGLAVVAVLLMISGTGLWFAVGAGAGLMCALGAGLPQAPWTQSLVSWAGSTARVSFSIGASARLHRLISSGQMGLAWAWSEDLPKYSWPGNRIN